MSRRDATTRRTPTPQLLELVAGQFRALAEPARLAILHKLEQGEMTVTELVEHTGMAQGNLSKHLQQLHARGFVERRRDGLFVYYMLADEKVLHLCELMCDRLEEDATALQRVVKERRSLRSRATAKSPVAEGSARQSPTPGATLRKSG